MTSPDLWSLCPGRESVNEKVTGQIRLIQSRLTAKIKKLIKHPYSRYKRWSVLRYYMGVLALI